MRDQDSAILKLKPEDPALTVVVIVLQGWHSLVRCLKALTQQVGGSTVEIIVPCDESLDDVPRLQTQFPEVDVLRVKGHKTFAELRALGIQKARGPIVALTEDHCVPDPDWCEEILKAHEAVHVAVGGAVEKQAPDTALNWAVYLSDYGRYMNPVREGPAYSLTDCNVSYKRSALDTIDDMWVVEFHEPTVHRALQNRGEFLWLSPRIIVRQQRSLRLCGAVWDRYAFGRLFASTRISGTSWPRRLAYAGFSFMLPPLLIGRIAASTLRKGRYLHQFVRAIPALILLTTVWAWGEFVGYLAGTPERSLMPEVSRTETRRQTGQEATA